MKKAVAFVLLCALLLSACAPEAVAPAPTETPPSPVAALEDVYVVQQGEAASDREFWPSGIEELARYRPFPGEYDDDTLSAMLHALPEIYIEGPKEGEKKIYFADDPFREGYVTSGSLSRKEIDALVLAIGQAQQGQALKAVLEGFGLSFEADGPYAREDFPLYNEYEETSYLASQRELEHGVIRVTVYPARDVYRTAICHIVFCKENGAYRFAAMNMPLVYSDYDDDYIVESGGRLYLWCGCYGGWGTGAYERDAALIPLAEGVRGYLYYQLEGYDCPWSFSEDLSIELAKVERTENGGTHFLLEGKFFYENILDDAYEGFEDIFRGTLTYHVYDDNDGKGFYYYDDDGSAWRFSSLYGIAPLKQALESRLALMLKAKDERACMLAEEFLWEQGIPPEGYPFLSYHEARDAVQAIQEKTYEAPEGDGRKYYIGSVAPQAEAGGSLTEDELAALIALLSDPDADAEAALSSAGLTLPDGVAVPKMPERKNTLSFSYADTYKRLVRYEKDDALVLELRVPDARYRLHESLALLFLREGASYVLTAAFTRLHEIDREVEQSTAALCNVNGAYYLRYQAIKRSRDDDLFMGPVWVPFFKGGTETKFLLSGDCALPGMPGKAPRYSLQFPADEELDPSAGVIDLSVSYLFSHAGVSFSIPLRLYNDGDGKGFYSLDPNSVHFFSDILSVPYAREQLTQQLRVRAKEAERYYRAYALMALEKLFGE